MKTAHVWIVEARFERNKPWGPTVGCGMDRSQGRAELKEWKHQNPDDSFRLRQYVRKEPK